MNKQKQGFTLVELIVVITLLAILGTIAIIAFSGYSKNARDSARISDIGNMNKILELWILKSGTYPEPTNGTGVTYSGSTVWNQGTFGDSVFQTVGKLDKKPIDPKYGTEYTYSITQSKKEYQIGAVLEKDMAFIDSKTGLENLIPQANAAGSTQGEAYVTGNYNGVLTTVGKSPTYVIALPSIILSSLTTTELKTVSPNVFVYEGKATLPASYANVGLTMTGGDFTFTPVIVWSGSTIGELNSQIEFQTLVENIQAAYKSDTAFSNLPEYASIVGTNNLSSEVMNFAKTLIETSTSRKLVNVSTIPLGISGVCGSEDNQYLGNSTSITGNGACTEGTLSNLTGAGPWTWECLGTYGQGDATCSAQKVVCNDGETVQNGQCKDPYWGNVVYLSHFDSGYTDVFGTTATSSNATLTSSSKIGSGALFFNSTASADALVTSANSNMALGINPFTVEFYLKMTNPGQVKHDYILFIGDNMAGRNAGTFGIHSIESSDSLQLHYGTGPNAAGLLLDSLTVPTANQWVHVAIVRDSSNNSYFFIDGVLKAKGSSWTQNLTGDKIKFAGWDVNHLYGGIDEFRITKGQARYTGSTIGQSYFTPATQAFAEQ